MGSFLEKGTGAFAEYSRVPSTRTISIPPSMSYNEAATVPLAGLTAASGLFQLLKLKEPPQEPSDTPLLVWAGSST
jgi:NADPH:quinone reductase